MPQAPTVSRVESSQTPAALLPENVHVPDYDTRQYDAEVFKQVTRIRESANSRITSQEDLSQIEQYMLRVFDRSTVLLSIKVQTWDEDRTCVTEIGIAIYDPRLQELSVSPNIKNYHFIIAENRNCRNGTVTPDHVDNFAGGTSHIFTKAQSREFMDGLMRHYFAPDFPLDCLLVGHRVQEWIKLLEHVDVFVHPKVPRLDTEELFALTNGNADTSLKDALFAVKQPYSFSFNAGNCAYYSLLLALKLCDPMVRWLRGIDFLKPNQEKGKKSRYKKAEVNKSRLRTGVPAVVVQEITRVGVGEWGR